MPSIYLDNSATTPLRPEVKEAMLPFLSDQWGNPSSVHRHGRAANKAVETARSELACLLNCEPDEIYFCPCATYANNTALIGRARFAEANGQGKHMITSRIEHPSCMGPAKYLESMGWQISYLPVNQEGLVDPQELERALTKDTSIISIMWANNEIGSLQPLEKLAAIAQERDIYFHTDAVQVPGKLAIDVKKLKVSALSISGHKFFAPKGVGALYLKKQTNLMPLVFGGGQEKGLFPGTESLANIVGLGSAARLAAAEAPKMEVQLRDLQRLLFETLSQVDGLKLTGPKDLLKRLPGHVSFVVPGVEGESIVLQSDLRGLAVSSASACHKGIMQPSHVVEALGYCNSDAMGSVRVSIGRQNSQDECLEAAKILLNVIESVQKSAHNTSVAGR